MVSFFICTIRATKVGAGRTARQTPEGPLFVGFPTGLSQVRHREPNHGQWNKARFGADLRVLCTNLAQEKRMARNLP
jgi:hypothetical protein